MHDHPAADFRLPTRLALSLLWASLMGLYIYNDYFSLYLPGTIENMSNGVMGPLGPASDGVLVAVSIMLAIPALMIFLSSAFPWAISRWSNVALGLAYTIIETMTFFGSPLFYKIVVVAEIAITLLIVVYAWRWKRVRS